MAYNAFCSNLSLGGHILASLVCSTGLIFSVISCVAVHWLHYYSLVCFTNNSLRFDKVKELSAYDREKGKLNKISLLRHNIFHGQGIANAEM